MIMVRGRLYKFSIFFIVPVYFMLIIIRLGDCVEFRLNPPKFVNFIVNLFVLG